MVEVAVSHRYAASKGTIHIQRYFCSIPLSHAFHDIEPQRYPAVHTVPQCFKEVGLVVPPCFLSCSTAARLLAYETQRYARFIAHEGPFAYIVEVCVTVVSRRPPGAKG